MKSLYDYLCNILIIKNKTKSKWVNAETKWVKNTSIIEAYHFTKENFCREKEPVWLKIAIEGEWETAKVRLWSQYGGNIIGGEVKTRKGRVSIIEGDYIVRNASGNFYVCDYDELLKEYTQIG